MTALERLQRCRACGVPLVCYTTSDEPAAIDAIVEQLGDGVAVLRWDAARGLHSATKAGEPVAATVAGEPDPYAGPERAIAAAILGMPRAPEGSALLVMGAHHLCQRIEPEAALKAARDVLASRGCTVVLLGPGWTWGADVAPHVETIDDEPPADEARRAMVRGVCESGGFPAPDGEADRLAVALTRGIPGRFGVEQAAALSMTPRGVDLAELRRRWRVSINATPGLTLDDTTRTLEDLGGLASIKDFARRLAGSKRPPSAVVLMDEGGKMLAGGGGASGVGDTSGASQGIEAALLTEMQDTRADGMICWGIAGAGKSASAQAIAAALGVPILRLDLGGLKDSLVGATERNTRAALKTIRALCGSGAFWILTANELCTIKPEVRRRFRSGIWYYDTPSDEERAAILAIYADRYSIPIDQPWPDMTGWTGAEVETCCERADAWGINPREAAAWIVPVSRMAAETVDAMRKAAAGRFLSASYPGAYSYHGAGDAPVGRRFAVKGVGDA